MKINKLIILGLLVFGASACQEEYEVPMIPGNEIAGEWYVQTFFGGSPVVGHQSILTYNTASATGDTIWFDDLGHIWPVKAKIPASPSSMSFAGTGDNKEVDPVYDTMDMAAPYDSLVFVEWNTVTVLEAKIIPDGGKSKTGVTTDSIYIRAEFSDDPGSEYEMAGHRRTGFLEDDY